MADDNKIEAYKMQYQTMLAEYQVMRQSIYDYRSMQGQLDNVTLAALGISIPVILTVLDRSLEHMGVILLIPILFFAVAFTQLRHERMLLLAAIYIDEELRPKIEQILLRISKENLSVLRWEEFLSRRSWTEGILREWLAVCLRAILGFGAGIGVMGVYAFIRFSLPERMYSFEAWLLVINGALLIIDLFIAFGIARQRQLYKKKNYYEKK
jgi:MFS family permease